MMTSAAPTPGLPSASACPRRAGIPVAGRELALWVFAQGAGVATATAHSCGVAVVQR